jgi:hypothetical protein
LFLTQQTFQAILGGQNCTVTLQQMSTGLYLTLVIAGAVIVGSKYCADRVSLVRFDFDGFSEHLYFLDSLGAQDPELSGVGTRFKLLYATVRDRGPEEIRQVLQ